MIFKAKSFRLPQIGTTVYMNVADGGVMWQLRRYRQVVKAGIAPTAERARMAAMEAWTEYSLEYSDVAERRSKARGKIAYFVKSRPYLVVACVAAALEPLNASKRWIAEAVNGERFWWEKDGDQFRKPLKKHHLQKPAPVVAKTIFSCFFVLGLIKRDARDPSKMDVRRLRTWARQRYGYIFEGENYGPGNDLEEPIPDEEDEEGGGDVEQ